MIVVIDQGIRVDAVDTFTELSVLATGLTTEDVAAAADSAAAGIVDGDHLWLDVDFLRSHGRDTAAWNEGFDAMLAYADRKGWTDPDRRRVRAHICGDAPVSD